MIRNEKELLMIIQKIVKGLRYYPALPYIRETIWEKMKRNMSEQIADDIPDYELKTIFKYAKSGNTLPDDGTFEEESLKNYANIIFERGILCRWWEKVKSLPASEIHKRLNERNLYWHQNKYSDLDPMRDNQPFSEETPFISTTAGTVRRDHFGQTNILEPAKLTALKFATDWWKSSGLVVFAYVFTLGKKSVGLRQFAEEIRELNIYTDFSPYQPEGEITAKIEIPTTQIERVEIWRANDFEPQIQRGYFNLNKPTQSLSNPNYLPPNDYNNIRELL